MIEILAPAKVNLTLRVLGKRPDGYHDLESLTCQMDLCDRLRITEEPSAISFSCDREELAGPDNLAWRAALLLKERSRTPRGAALRLEKRIPAGAGLGGGSSDAAAALRGLSRLWGLGWDTPRLAELGAGLGSDVPLFLHPSPALMTGRGETVTPLQVRVDAHFLLVYPGFPVSTAWAYGNFRLTRKGSEDRIARLLDKLREGIVPDSWGEVLVNDLEEGVFPRYPVLRELKELLLRQGARASLLSGSGSTVFGLFDQREAAEDAAGALAHREGWSVFLARPVCG